METTETKLLKELAVKAIEELKHMPQPVVRVCGPMTTGGRGYEENVRMFEKAVAELRQGGYTVFDFAPYEPELLQIKASHSAIMEDFHKPILQSGYITTAFFLPAWNESKGATWEREYIEANTKMDIQEFTPTE
ncbi:MAG: DUF4406 domain-containing protein [Patescibacteria group bacterium]